MKKIFTLTMALCLAVVGFAQYTMEDRIYDYIDDYKNLAMQEMELYGVPASITLAQAIYASQAGSNDLVRECHNHFAIMCHTQEWTGDTYYRPADKNHEFCYRKYATDAESYRDHSLFLSTRSRYVKLFYYPITDYKSWANGLLEAGFSGNPKYADTLVSIIEKYYLMHYDRKVAQKLGDTLALKAVQKPQPAAPATATVTTPVAKSEPVAQVAQPKAEPSQPKTEPSQPKTEPSQPKTEPSQPKTEPSQPKGHDETVILICKLRYSHSHVGYSGIGTCCLSLAGEGEVRHHGGERYRGDCGETREEARGSAQAAGARTGEAARAGDPGINLDPDARKGQRSQRVRVGSLHRSL